MKTKNYAIASLAFMLSGISLSFAQPTEPKPETTVFIIGMEDNNNKSDIIKSQTIKFLQANHVKAFREVGMPQFVITDAKNRAIFAIGGFVQFRTGYDFNNVIQNKDFVTFDIPMNENASNREKLLMDASTSRIYFKSLIKTRPLGTVEAYIETDFRGGDNVLRLRKAYVKLLGLTLGQNTSLMTDGLSSFNTIDFEGPNAYTYLRQLGIQYNRDLGKGFSMGVGLEYPVISATTRGELSTIIPQRIPDVPLFFQYEWNKNSHVRATGLMRNMFYHNNINNEDVDVVGWGAQFSTIITASRSVQFYGNAIYGKGIGNYVNDLEGNGMDLLSSRSKLGSMDAPETFAWLVGAQFNITPKMPLTLGYSQVRQYGDDVMINQNGFKLSQYVVGNLFYNINRNLSVGVEYLFGTRYDTNDHFGRANRVQAMVQLNF